MGQTLAARFGICHPLLKFLDERHHVDRVKLPKVLLVNGSQSVSYL